MPAKMYPYGCTIMMSREACHLAEADCSMAGSKDPVRPQTLPNLAEARAMSLIVPPLAMMDFSNRAMGMLKRLRIMLKTEQ